MKQVYIIKDRHPRLLLFFAGWGADKTPFKDYQPADSDYMLCYDYRTLDFDASLLKGYKEINVIGWSMGVWAASRVMDKLQEADLIIKNSIAQTMSERKQGFTFEIAIGTITHVIVLKIGEIIARSIEGKR